MFCRAEFWALSCLFLSVFCVTLPFLVFVCISGIWHVSPVPLSAKNLSPPPSPPHCFQGLCTRFPLGQCKVRRWFRFHYSPSAHALCPGEEGKRGERQGSSNARVKGDNGTKGGGKRRLHLYNHSQSTTKVHESQTCGPFYASLPSWPSNKDWARGASFFVFLRRLSLSCQVGWPEVSDAQHIYPGGSAPLTRTVWLQIDCGFGWSGWSCWRWRCAQSRSMPPTRCRHLPGATAKIEACTVGKSRGRNPRVH